ncbi:MAG: glutathione S-transferase N-terminal domain-containing protein [Pseudomonadota bacterium]
MTDASDYQSHEHQPLVVRGAPGSPYTRKLLAVLRFRRIPYAFHHSTGSIPEGWPKPKVSLIPVVYFSEPDGELSAQVDTTPLIRRLEEAYAGRSVLPEQPALRWLNDLLEDYADEWLTKAMFHYRWHYAADAAMASSILPFYQGVTLSPAQAALAKEQFARRQIERLYVVGSNDTTAPVIESSYRRFLACFATHLEHEPFLFGKRPLSADFACFGQLTQLAHFDPTPARMTADEYPRVHAWVSGTEDQSGLAASDRVEDDLELARDTLRPLLEEIGSTYAPVMLANAQALQSGVQEVVAEVHGARWVQEPFPYQGKCVATLRAAYQALDTKARADVDALLEGSGCEALLR